MSRRRLIFIGLVSWLAAGSVSAQDTKMSHPFMWKSFNNPGYTGFEGLASVNVGCSGRIGVIRWIFCG